MKYLNLKFGLYNLPKNVNNNYIKCFENVFDISLPNELVLHNYAFNPEEQCNRCARIVDCKDKYLSDIEKNVNKMFKWRNYDEIHQIKDVINQRNKIDGVINPIEIKNEFIDIRNKLNKRIKKVFPKVKRWPNLSTIMSVPDCYRWISYWQPRPNCWRGIYGWSVNNGKRISYLLGK